MSAYYLDCPFEEKDQAKSLGARWDAKARKWFVPSEFYPMIEQFNRWKPNGKVFLDCPYEEREAVKKAGAVWDGHVKRWCVITKTVKVPKQFSKWLTVDPSPDSFSSSPPPSSSSPAKPAAARRRGNAADATLLRINDNMTVTQLQEECKYRGIKGLSGKNKDWLLEQLEIGSIWQVNRQQQATASPAAAAPATSTKKATTTSTKKNNTDSNNVKSKSSTSNSEKRPAKASKTTNESSPKKAKLAKAKESNTKATEKRATIDFSGLPRITSSLTIAQLSHELMFRDSTTKGISNKPKPWFLARLGEDSIWTTCPDLSVDLSNAPRVSKSMTVAQLVHELLTRTPSMTGLSSKKKEELLSLAGEGSIWITGRQEPAHNDKTAETPTSSKSKPSKEELKSKNNKGVPPASKKNTAVKEPVVKNMSKDSKSTLGATMPSATKKVSPFAKAPTAKKTNTLKPTAAKAIKAPAAVKSSGTTESGPVHVNKKKTTTKVKAEPVSSSGTAKQVRIPVISENMTKDQLKKEILARDPNSKGFSSKGKDWLLDYRSVAMELRDSEKYKAMQADIADKLHVHQSLCHVHRLADSSELRAPPGMGFPVSQKRVHVSSCDVRHARICRRTSFRSCERCDYDICKSCYEIESLPANERKPGIDRRLGDMMRQQAALQRQHEEREKERRRRVIQRENEYKARREQRMHDLYGEDLERFPEHIRNPSSMHKDPNNKLEYTVWTCDVHRKQLGSEVDKEFNSSFATLEEANLRVEFVFYYANPWDLDKDEMYADTDDETPQGLRRMESHPDGGGSLTVAVMPSDAFDILHGFFDDDQDTSTIFPRRRLGGAVRGPREKEEYPSSICNPPARHTNEEKRLTYTVWTSCGYDYDGWHSYSGPPSIEFNSSYNTLEEANDRAEYVFYHDNPWGLRVGDEFEAEVDVTKKSGLRYLECRPDDSERWTVSVVPSFAFDYIND